MKPRSRGDWIKFGVDVAEKLIGLVYERCRIKEGKPLHECFRDVDVRDLAEKYMGLPEGVSDEEAELLGEMPEDVYEIVNDWLHVRVKMLKAWEKWMKKRAERGESWEEEKRRREIWED